MARVPRNCASTSTARGMSSPCGRGESALTCDFLLHRVNESTRNTLFTFTFTRHRVMAWPLGRLGPPELRPPELYAEQCQRPAAHRRGAGTLASTMLPSSVHPKHRSLWPGHAVQPVLPAQFTHATPPAGLHAVSLWSNRAQKPDAWLPNARMASERTHGFRTDTGLYL